VRLLTAQKHLISYRAVVALSIPFEASKEGKTVMVMVGVPERVNASIGSIGEVDTYEVDLTAGQTYHFDVIGHLNGDSDPTSPELFDPTLTLTAVTASGQSVFVFDDDGGPGFNSHIDFTAPEDGTYTLSVAGYEFTQEIGDYTLYTEA
jgi:hypothetical protein